MTKRTNIQNTNKQTHSNTERQWTQMESEMETTEANEIEREMGVCVRAMQRNEYDYKN